MSQMELNCAPMLNWIVWYGTVLIRNVTGFDIETVLMLTGFFR